MQDSKSKETETIRFWIADFEKRGNTIGAV
jgi:hypothetical protein